MKAAFIDESVYAQGLDADAVWNGVLHRSHDDHDRRARDGSDGLTVCRGRTNRSFVMAGLDPAIHLKNKRLYRSAMNARAFAEAASAAQAGQARA